MFNTALTNVLVTLFYMVPGFILRKMNKASEDDLPTLSAILIYIGTPFLLVSAFMAIDFSWADMIGMLQYFLISFCLQSVFMLILYLLLKRRYGESNFRLLTIATVLGNVGFFGLPIIRSLFPNNPEVLCFCAVNNVTMNILTFTVGIFCLTNNKKYISIRRALINPTVLGFLAAMPFYIFNLKSILPTVILDAIKTVGNIATPLCMFLVGIRLASEDFKTVFNKPIVYLIASMKLIIFPLFCFAVISLFPVSSSFRATVTILAATPCATTILGFSEIHNTDPEMAARCIFVSTIFCFITIPLITLLLR